MNNLPIQTYESVVQHRDALEKKLAEMAAENAALNKFIKADCWVWDDKSETYFDAIDGIPETPATDSFTRELMAKGVEAFAVMIGTPRPDDVRDDFFESLCKQFEKSANDFASDIRKGINDAQ